MATPKLAVAPQGGCRRRRDARRPSPSPPPGTGVAVARRPAHANAPARKLGAAPAGAGERPRAATGRRAAESLLRRADTPARRRRAGVAPQRGLPRSARRLPIRHRSPPNLARTGDCHRPADRDRACQCAAAQARCRAAGEGVARPRPAERAVPLWLRPGRSLSARCSPIGAESRPNRTGACRRPAERERACQCAAAQARRSPCSRARAARAGPIRADHCGSRRAGTRHHGDAQKLSAVAPQGRVRASSDARRFDAGCGRAGAGRGQRFADRGCARQCAAAHARRCAAGQRRTTHARAGGACRAAPARRASAAGRDAGQGRRCAGDRRARGGPYVRCARTGPPQGRARARPFRRSRSSAVDGRARASVSPGR